jgi:prepilin-type N-terminal cleavage/methylation domain-containing protein
MRTRGNQTAAARSEGFTLIEVLIVVVVLGILSAIVVFSLFSTTTHSVVVSCSSDARAVNLAGRALVTENPNQVPTTSGPGAGSWYNQLLPGSTLTGSPFLHSWPTSSYYSISVAGTSAPPTTGDVPPVSPANGDVIVTTPVGAGAHTYDATQQPGSACSKA